MERYRAARRRGHRSQVGQRDAAGMRRARLPPATALLTGHCSISSSRSAKAVSSPPSACAIRAPAPTIFFRRSPAVTLLIGALRRLAALNARGALEAVQLELSVALRMPGRFRTRLSPRPFEGTRLFVDLHQASRFPDNKPRPRRGMHRRLPALAALEVGRFEGIRLRNERRDSASGGRRFARVRNPGRRPAVS